MIRRVLPNDKCITEDAAVGVCLEDLGMNHNTYNAVLIGQTPDGQLMVWDAVRAMWKAMSGDRVALRTGAAGRFLITEERLLGLLEEAACKP